MVQRTLRRPDTAAESRTAPANMADLVLRHGRSSPEAVALIEPASEGGTRVSYGALCRRAAGIGDGLGTLGLRSGERVVVLVRPSVDLYALLVGIFAAGLVAVVLDGTLGRARLGRALADARPAAVLGPRRLKPLRLLVPALRRLRWIPLEHPALRAPRPEVGFPPAFSAVECEADTPAVISFTTGSTGRPKGAVRTHGLLVAQHLALRAVFPDRPDEVALTLFPLVGLHHLCCGHTVVLPGRPPRSGCGAAALLERLRRHRVTALSMAPAALEATVDALEGQGARLWEVRHLIGGGGPMSRGLCRRVSRCFPAADARVVYGSTEAEPIASVSMAEVAGAPGGGHLVGAPVPMVDLELVRLPDDIPAAAVASLAPWRVAPGESGEVVVRGAHVVRGYFENAEADAATKVPSGAGVWHRTGDLGRLDAQGRLWLTGRAGEAVLHDGACLHPLELEAELAEVPGVRRVALVTHARAPEGVVVVEAERGLGRETRGRVRSRLDDLGLSALPVRVVRRVPVDARHRSKIDRAALRRRLARWWGRE